MRVLLLAITVLMLGCRSEDIATVEAKLDAPLRVKLEQLQRDKKSETLGLLGKCSRPVDGPMRDRLRRAGAEVQSVTGDLFAARASSEKVVRIAQLDFVTQLQLSQTSQPLGP